eukprot:TRINITY_DN3896_c0_g1_i4.p1 TRINITY_DN3896_c0_g1~~TRINITY_DN3896_c0_g1_i4.p1  ORF type:complete len:412 (+),score=73.44 TRINITY_DN3896_c0_g1_i4:50-1285(+)
MSTKDFLESPVTAWISVILSSICYGSSYIVTKRYPTGDGFMFAWAMSMGSLLVGFLCTLFNKLIFVPSGLIGGGLWSIGNLMTIIAIRLIGLGPAYSIWCIACLVSGWLCGRLGSFGIGKPDIQSEALNILGALVGVSAIVVFYYVRKNEQLEDDEWVGYEKYRPYRGAKLTSDSAAVNDDQLDLTGESKGFLAVLDNLEKTPKQILGVFLACLIGIIYGFTGIPNQLWYEGKQDDEDKTGDDDYTPLDFIFSQFIAIFLFNSFVFMGYIIYNNNQPQVGFILPLLLPVKPIYRAISSCSRSATLYLLSYLSDPDYNCLPTCLILQIFPETILPSMFCGFVWGIASALNFISNGQLSYGISFPMVCMGPVIVTALWSVLYFKEISHPKHLRMLMIALVLNLVGVLFIAFSV